MSGVTGAGLRETSFINRSLSALADVLGAISEHRSHVPYRNSKLTHLLQDSIGDYSLCYIFHLFRRFVLVLSERFPRLTKKNSLKMQHIGNSINKTAANKKYYSRIHPHTHIYKIPRVIIAERLVNF